MILIPAPGRLVRDPHTKQPLPAEGRDVAVLTSFWLRRLAAGDVIEKLPAKKETSK